MEHTEYSEINARVQNIREHLIDESTERLSKVEQHDR